MGIAPLIGGRSGNSLPDYSIVSDGTTITLLDKGGGTVSSNATDAGALVTTALAALPAAGGHIAFRNDGNVFPWTTVPALPRSISRKLMISGNGSTVQLSSAGPRFFDFNKVADHDTFKNIEINGFTVDVNNIGGRHHVILGTYIAGVNQQRINMDQIYIRNIRTINVPIDSNLTNHRLNIYLVTQQALANEGTTNTVTGIFVEDCRFEGGNIGCSIGGNVASGTQVGLNITFDDVHIRRCWHSLLSAPSVVFTSTNFLIGAGAKGGYGEVVNCYGQYSGDSGIEIDSAQESLVLGCLVEDAATECYLKTNFQAPTNINGQMLRFISCDARRTVATLGCGFRATSNNSVALGNLVIRDCSWYRNTADVPTAAADAIDIPGGLPIASLTVENFKATLESINYTSASNLTHQLFQLTFPTGPTLPTLLKLRNVNVAIGGQRSGAGVYTLKCFQIAGSVILDVDDVALDVNISTMSNFGTIGFELGVTTSTMRGHIRRFKFIRASSDTGPRGIRVTGTGALTIAPNQLEISGCDFTALPSGASEILYVATTNISNVRARSNVWKNGNTRPVPTTLTGLTTATGAPLATGYDCMVTFTQGSGAAITAIDYSLNGGTTYTNFLTQASAALPAGFDQSLGPLPSDALIKVTFTTTQPTITLVPVNP